MSIFPDITIPEITTQSSTVTYGRELDFDFTTGQFVLIDGTPRVLEGPDALRIWITKTLLTARYRFPIYSFNYGCEIEDVIGYDIPRVVLESEIPRVIREALIYDERINDIRDFIITRESNYLLVEFSVITFDGQTLIQGVTYSV
jgi:hypothetical protein